MDKEALKLKVATLAANLEVKSDERNTAAVQLETAKNELRDVGKPVITEDVANEIVSRVCNAFCESLGNIDSDDIDADEDSIMEILIDTFNIDHSNGEDGNDID